MCYFTLNGFYLLLSLLNVKEEMNRVSLPPNCGRFVTLSPNFGRVMPVSTGYFSYVKLYTNED
jgi:hypothetical protein